MRYIVVYTPNYYPRGAEQDFEAIFYTMEEAEKYRDVVIKENGLEDYQNEVYILDIDECLQKLAAKSNDLKSFFDL